MGSDSSNETDTRSCGWCGASLAGMSKRAQYCSKTHKGNAHSKRFRESNPGYFARYTKSETRMAYEAQNIERIRERARIRSARVRATEEGREYNRAWWEANKQKHRLYQHVRRHRKANNPGSVGVSERDWNRLVSRYLSCCAYCDVRVDEPHMDHVIPLARGGRHAIGNVLPSCRSCNVRKSSTLLSVWKYRRRQADGIAA